MSKEINFIIEDLTLETLMKKFEDKYFRKRLKAHHCKYQAIDVEYKKYNIEAFNCAYEDLLQFRKEKRLMHKIMKYYRYG